MSVLTLLPKILENLYEFLALQSDNNCGLNGRQVCFGIYQLMWDL